MDRNHTSDQTAQQQTAIAIQLCISFLSVIVGFPLFVIGIIALANQETWVSGIRQSAAKGSYIAMLVVGILIIALAAWSIYLSVSMILQMKNTHDIKLETANLLLISLNYYGYVLIRNSHGILSRGQKRKAAKKLKKTNKKQTVQQVQPVTK